MNEIITLKNLTKEYGGKKVVSNISLDIKHGEFITLLGPSGCGKTTTLRMIAGFETPSSGEIMFEGQPLIEIPPYKRAINTVFQRYALFPHMNVEGNISFGLKMKRIETEVTKKNGSKVIKMKRLSKHVINSKVHSALKLVGLTDYEKRDVNSLSGGQMQRVAIARAIVNEPKVLLLDEPLGALDLKMRQEMQLELKSMHKRLGITFIYVTHDQEEALTMSDTIVIMKDGYICQVGSPTDIYNEPTNAFVADFIGESNILDGVMLQDRKVKFCNQTFECVDTGFEKNCLVDVVIRPEDFEITKKEAGLISGEVTSSIFKGVHYEVTIKCGTYEVIVHTTLDVKVKSNVGLKISPENIHIMNKDVLTNEFEATFINNTTLSLNGNNYEYNPTLMFDGVTIDSETNSLMKNGEVFDVKNLKAIVNVALDKIDLTDSEHDAPMAGNVTSILFKGDHYFVCVRCNGVDIFTQSTYLWDDGDRVGIAIKPEDIQLVKMLEVNVNA